MIIWDISPRKLCRNHLLGEHCELHAMWVVITQNKKRYSMHPETIRWKEKLNALYLRHKALVMEVVSRVYSHKSTLDKRKATGSSVQDVFIDSPLKQILILKEKKCDCKA